jgi:hypothetical protein
MSAFYEAVGRIVVTFIRVRYRREIRVVGALAVASVLVGGYLLARREVEEG